MRHLVRIAYILNFGNKEEKNMHVTQSGKTTVYKIQNTEGLFSTGGKYPNFSSHGKTWDDRSGLTKHLRTVCDNEYFNYRVGTKVIEYEISIREVQAYPVIDHKLRIKQSKVEEVHDES